MCGHQLVETTSPSVYIKIHIHSNKRNEHFIIANFVVVVVLHGRRVVYKLRSHMRSECVCVPVRVCILCYCFVVRSKMFRADKFRPN